MFLLMRWMIVCYMFFLALRVDAQIYVRQHGTKQQPVLVAYNDTYAPYQIALTFTKLTNMKVNHRFQPVRIIVPPKSKRELARLWPAYSNSSFQWSYKYQTYLGDPRANHSSYQYVAPFISEAPMQVTQSFGGSFSHKDIENYHAVDIALPVGTLVVAARPGRVVAIEQGNISSGTQQSLKSKSNFIRILHNDGTMAEYHHLRWASIRPRLGSDVKQGQIIAQSGNVGYSTGPHLHFVIKKNFGQSIRTVPFKFTTGTPVQGQMIDGYLPVNTR